MADIIVIEPTESTPSVKFDRKGGSLTLKGNSMPEDPIKFYLLILELLDDYIKQPAAQTTLNIHFKYINTMSTKCLYDLLKKTEALLRTRHKVTVNWYYQEEDDDIMEKGMDYKELINLPFNIVQVQ